MSQSPYRQARGSSPRMRGTPAAGAVGAHDGRFIPAHAGNTGLWLSVSPCAPVHPRACGEHHRITPVGPWRFGSSPRMRGTQANAWHEANSRRFIPAHAGNTSRRTLTALACAVHPRACGEHRVFIAIRCLVIGSSPRMRGTRSLALSASIRRRFIPAHAGNTPAPAAATSARPVHPRACGEHASDPCQIGKRTGSSPRMRGTLALPIQLDAIQRFIPAHAGNTCRRAW